MLLDFVSILCRTHDFSFPSILDSHALLSVNDHITKVVSMLLVKSICYINAISRQPTSLVLFRVSIQEAYILISLIATNLHYQLLHI